MDQLKRSKAERTFDKLVAATLAEICDHGGFTAQSVAHRAETSPATFFARFTSKEVALTAAFSAALDKLVVIVEQTWNIEVLLDKGLAFVCRSAVDESINYFQTHALVFRLALAQLPASKSIRSVFRSHEESALTCYERFVHLGQRAGMVRSGETQTMTTALLVHCQGFNNPNLFTDSQQGVRAELARALYLCLAPDESN